MTLHAEHRVGANQTPAEPVWCLNAADEMYPGVYQVLIDRKTGMQNASLLIKH